MPRFGRVAVQEKSKDFKGSMKRLIANLKPWKYIMIVALILAMTSAVLSLISPDLLSNLTDEVTKGIKPDQAKFEEIIENININLNSEKIDKKLSNLENEVSMTEEELSEVNNVFNILHNSSEEDSLSLLLELPDSVLLYLLDDIKFEKVIITSEEQLEILKAINKINPDDSASSLKAIDELPSNVYDLIKPKIDMVKVKNITIVIAILYLISSVFSYIQSYSMSTVSNRFANNLRRRISTKINQLPLKYFDTHETGDVLSRVTNDVDTVSQNLNNSLAILVSSITLFLGSIFMMFTTNWLMAVTAVLSTFVGFIAMFIILNKSQKYFSKQQEELGNVNGYVEEMYSGHNVVKVYNGTKKAMKEFSTLNDRLYIANKKSRFLSGMMQPIMAFVGNFGYVMVCIVGALLVMNGKITFGVIVAFMIYIRLFTNPLSQIAQAMTSLQSTVAASERVFEFLDEKEMPTQKDLKKHLNKSKVKGEIEFRNVKFGYNPGRTIIKNFSVKVKPGQKIAIVGPTGAGKTTMVNLLMKFYDINNGDILIDGVSTKELSRENVHELFVMVLQDTWLFEGTIGDNIRFNKEDVSDRKIWEALKTVGVDHFVSTLPGGLDYQISDNDAISQGQKQLLTIARGMIEDAPFLILDEATSNVDTRTEELVQKAMDKLMEGRTSFIIAHRLSTIRNADLILVMKDGNIVEQGTHDELLDQNGFYASLYNSQFEK